LLKRSCSNFSVANRHFCTIFFDLRVALFASVKICYCQGWSVVNGTVMGTVTRAVMSTSGHCYLKKIATAQFAAEIFLLVFC